MSFDTLGLDAALLRAVAREGYDQPTPIQARAIPVVLSRRDVLAAAQTGTGKTAAFTLPLLQRLAAGTAATPRALILTPTRELAAQVHDSVRACGKGLDLKTVVVFGGVGYQPQIKAFRKGVDIVVATPGRLLDHLQNGHIDLSGIEILVLDEADRMLDMGFVHDIKRIQKHLPAARQSLLFSATFSRDIRRFATRMLDNPVEIDVAPRNTTARDIEQQLVFTAKSRKRAVASHLISDNDWQQVLIFTRTKHGANRLCKQLDSDGLPAAALHGNKSQSARTRALDGFKKGRIRVLVATDIAARGIDIEHLPHVINFDLPTVAEDYVHRIGRTGRAGNTGQALSLVAPDERKQLKAIERLIGHNIERLEVTGVDVRDHDDNHARADRQSKPSRPRNDKQPSSKTRPRRQRKARPGKHKRPHGTRQRNKTPARTGS